MNDASEEDLERVFQMDGERARYLIDTRNRLGRFTSWEQCRNLIVVENSRPPDKQETPPTEPH